MVLIGVTIQAKKFVVKHIKTKFADKVEEEREKVRLTMHHSRARYEQLIDVIDPCWV